jgi:hypothetical protein
LEDLRLWYARRSIDRVGERNRIVGPTVSPEFIPRQRIERSIGRSPERDRMQVPGQRRLGRPRLW